MRAVKAVAAREQPTEMTAKTTAAAPKETPPIRVHEVSAAMTPQI